MVLSLTRSLPIVQPASESRHLIDTTTGQVADCGSVGCRQFDLMIRCSWNVVSSKRVLFDLVCQRVRKRHEITYFRIYFGSSTSLCRPSLRRRRNGRKD